MLIVIPKNKKNVLPRRCAINTTRKFIWNGKQPFRIIAHILPVYVYNKQVFPNLWVRVAPLHLQLVSGCKQSLLFTFSAARTLGLAMDYSFCFGWCGFFGFLGFF